MLFSINAYKYLFGTIDTYRLQKDHAWIQQSDFEAFNPDTNLLFDSFTEAESWLQLHNPITINGEIVDINGNGTSLSVDQYEFKIIVHRMTRPKNPIFTREQLKTVLLNGDDNYSNSLVIDYDGYPQLVQHIDRTPAHITEYPVRYESFSSGAGYVGSEESLNHLEEVYLALLEAWEMHLSTGCSVYCDCFIGEMTAEQLRTKIMETIHNLA